jgi:hypothetical protein
VSFADWVNNGWLVAHKRSKQEIGNLLGIVARDLKDSQAKDVSAIGGSRSLTTRHCRLRRRPLRPLSIARPARIITTGSFSHWN